MTLPVFVADVFGVDSVVVLDDASSVVEDIECMEALDCDGEVVSVV